MLTCPPPPPLQNVDILKDPETVKQLGSILKTNVRACKAVGHPFVIQLGRIYLDMLNVYKCLSENISAAIQTNGGWGPVGGGPWGGARVALGFRVGLVKGNLYLDMV